MLEFQITGETETLNIALKLVSNKDDPKPELLMRTLSESRGMILLCNFDHETGIAALPFAFGTLDGKVIFLSLVVYTVGEMRLVCYTISVGT